jgi:hypothetical protein
MPGSPTACPALARYQVVASPCGSSNSSAVRNAGRSTPRPYTKLTVTQIDSARLRSSRLPSRSARATAVLAYSTAWSTRPIMTVGATTRRSLADCGLSTDVMEGFRGSSPGIDRGFAHGRRSANSPATHVATCQGWPTEANRRGAPKCAAQAVFVATAHGRSPHYRAPHGSPRIRQVVAGKLPMTH